MENKITPLEIKEQLSNLYQRQLIDRATCEEILNKLGQEDKYDERFFQELLKRFKERLDFKLEQGMLNYLKKNLDK